MIYYWLEVINMKDMYEESLQMIKDLQRIPSEREWNSIAKEKCLLSWISLEYIANRKFYWLCRKVRRAS